MDNQYKVLKLKKTPQTFYVTNGRTYYKGDDKKIYMSQVENPKYQNLNYVRKNNLVFYNANNKMGEPEFALDKNKYGIRIINNRKTLSDDEAKDLFKKVGTYL